MLVHMLGFPWAYKDVISNSFLFVYINPFNFANCKCKLDTPWQKS